MRKSRRSPGPPAVVESSTPCCDLCGRVKPLTDHHLLPRAVHRRKKFVALFGKREMQSRKLLICRLCHNGIHDLIPDERVLAEQYNTRELLLAHAGLRRHVAWVRKQK